MAGLLEEAGLISEREEQTEALLSAWNSCRIPLVPATGTWRQGSQGAGIPQQGATDVRLSLTEI